MKIVYFHGFASSGASGTVQLLRRLLPEDEVIAPDIPVDPADALPFLLELCAAEQPDLVVGTSMGGMYAQQMRGFVRICVNPAFNMSTMSKVLRTGMHKFLNGRKDNAKEFRITQDILRNFNKMERAQFKDIAPGDRERCYGLFGTEDRTVNPVNAYNTFRKHYTHAIRFEGGHQLNEKALKGTLLPLVRRLVAEGVLPGGSDEARA